MIAASEDTAEAPRNQADRHILLCADSRYVVPLAVTLRSIAESQRSPELLRITVLSVGIASEDQDLLKASAPMLSLNFVPIAHLIPSDIPVMGHLNKASYGWLFGVDTMPSGVERVVYLDADVVVKEDLGFLFSFDLGASPLAAVQDQGMPHVSNSAWANWRRRGLSPTTPYLNSGVLVIDTAAWRARNLTTEVIDFVMRHRDEVRYGDQDGLNGALSGGFARLPIRWNTQFELRRPGNFAYSVFDEDEVDQAIHSPAIVHYNGAACPWTRTCTDSAMPAWLDLLTRTEFCDHKMPRLPLKTKIEAIGRKILRV